MLPSQPKASPFLERARFDCVQRAAPPAILVRSTFHRGNAGSIPAGRANKINKIAPRRNVRVPSVSSQRFGSLWATANDGPAPIESGQPRDERPEGEAKCR